jgi:prevent-host-death family protein
MVEVGVKELKNELSAYLRRVQRGERVRVTLRGKAVAELAPPREETQDERRQRLIDEGTLTPATKPMPRKPPPLAEPVPGPSGSDMIIADREADRLERP